MSRTFIGELILRLKDELSGKAKTAAGNLETSVDKIQRAAQQLNRTTWGGQFEERLRKLGTSSADIDKLRVAWDSLHTSMTSRDLSKSLQSMEKSNFKTAALGYFTDVASRANDAEKSIDRMHSRWKTAAADMAVYSTTGALMYGGVNALRGAVEANAAYQRELFRQENASLPTTERLRIAERADRLTTQYPSAGIVDVMEMARAARNMMGTTDRSLQILPDLVKALVSLQTAKGPDAAPEELSRLLRAIDNSGKNSEGDLGIKDTREIIAGLIRAAQIEGNELNVGDMWTFMRRAKIAGPGFSTDFLANVAPGLVQDMTAPSAGTALSSAFQAFVIGAKDTASKVNLAEQERIGIRKGGKLNNSQLMGENPYQWAKDVLLPALQKDGVDINNDTALAESIAKLTRNSPASAMLTKMLQQREQLDKTIGLYRNAKGLDAANDAMAKDPFVAARGFTESLRELATSIKGMPEAVGILNGLTGGLQRFATALKEQDGGAQALLAGAGLGAGFAAWKVTAGIYGLITAGTNLNAAAVALQAAAVSLGGQGIVDNLADGKKGGWLSKITGVMPWLAAAGARVSGPAAAALTTYEALNSVPHAGIESASKDDPEYFAKREAYRRQFGDVPFEGGMHRAGLGAGPRPGSWYPNIDFETRTDSIKATPEVDMSSADTARRTAEAFGNDIANALAVTATPLVNTAQLREAVALASQLKSVLTGIGPAVQAAHSSVSRAMNRNFTDQGVTP